MEEVLGYLAARLEEYLAGYYECPEGVVRLGMSFSGETEEEKDKLALGILNLERETAAGNGGNSQALSGGRAGYQPALYLNLYFLVAAVFKGEKYRLGLKLLNYALNFFQYSASVVVGNEKYTIEPVTLNLQELTNVWSILGGHYYPSMVYKLRRLTVSGQEIVRSVERVHQIE